MFCWYDFLLIFDFEFLAEFLKCDQTAYIIIKNNNTIIVLNIAFINSFNIVVIVTKNNDPHPQPPGNGHKGLSASSK